MSSIDRQNRLLLAEDWKKIYQSFKNADFKSYDFDNLRRTMIEYLRTNYPEDFNDYIESSEYLALIDMIAFLGQNISFRTDLNARENYIELAERRESVLRLARLVSYNPQRNRSANGLLKFSSVQTTENVRDSNGNNLSGRSIIWNDSVNSDWFEQFTKVINSALPKGNAFGKAISRENIEGIPTEQYTFNSSTQGVPVFSFNKSVNNQKLEFEVVSTIIDNTEIIEEPPNPTKQLSFIYRDNGQGPANNSTGFFLHFRQGSLQRSDFILDYPVPNQRVDIDAASVNQTDIWLYSVGSDGIESDIWTKVDAVEGNNIVYNSLAKNIKNIFSVLTRTDDRISLIFSDGVFGKLPKGVFRTYYRTGVNRDYTILPSNLTNVTIRVPYISAIGRSETLTVTLELKNAVSNGTSSESTESIKANAPSTYYTQNRMVTAEDYNIGPLAISQDIIKVKSVNRTASGISKYYDLVDPTGKYSKTDMFATDGIIYKTEKENTSTFSFVTKTDIESIINNKISEIVNDKNVTSFYLDKYSPQEYEELGLQWEQTTNDTNRSTGYVKDTNGIIYQVGEFTSGSLRFLESNAMIRFKPPAGNYFLPEGKLTTDASEFGAKNYHWCKVITISDSINVTGSLGPIVLNDNIPTGCTIDKIIPKFVREVDDSVKSDMIDKIFAYKTFGLRYNILEREWTVIDNDNLSITNNFSLGQAGDDSNSQLDSSWIILFETKGESYEITYRSLTYIFESLKEIKFYFDSNKKIYDSKTGKIVKDKITILNINNDLLATPATMPYTRDFDWQITSDFRDTDGYVDSRKVEIIFFDSDDDGIVDDIELFNLLVPSNNYVFTKKEVISSSEYESPVDVNVENIQVTNSPNTLTPGNPVFYIPSEDNFYRLDSETRILTITYDYKAYLGRKGLKFQYVHASDESSRIDPSSSNIIDSYILTRQYDTAFRFYLSGQTTAKPLPMSSEQLYRSYGQELNKIKSISDELIYHPAKYKILFGNKADKRLQATFKVVKNTDRNINDNAIKSKIISAINRFFALENWDFGETFYWSELSSYITKEVAPDISSIVIVPKSTQIGFGSLMEIKAEIDEVLISGATVDDIEIISAITADRLKSENVVVNSTNTSNSGVQSSTGNSTNTSGGYIF